MSYPITKTVKQYIPNLAQFNSFFAKANIQINITAIANAMRNNIIFILKVNILVSEAVFPSLIFKGSLSTSDITSLNLFIDQGSLLKEIYNLLVEKSK